MHKLIGLGVLALTLCVGGCGSSPTAPTVSLAGNWTGNATVPGSPAGTGAVRVTLAQNGNTVSGTWGSSYQNAIYNNGGSLSGTIAGTSVTMTLSSGVPTACPLSLAGTLNGSISISGTFATFNCTVAQFGSFGLFKS